MTLRRVLALGMILASAAFLAVEPARAGGNLFIFTWTDYTSPALIAKFERETGVKVSIDTYESNETLLAKLKSGSMGYDIVVISSDFVPIFVKEGLIQKVDTAHLPGFDNIEPRWRHPAWDGDEAYTVPFGWGVTGFAINTTHIKAPVDSLQTLFEPPPEAKGKVGMFSAPSEVMSLAEVDLGLAPCQTDVASMKRVYGLLAAQAPSVNTYSSDGIIERLSSDETWIQQVWNGDAARARRNNPAIRFIFPKEGAVGWMDTLAIPADARDRDNAELFLAFMLRPENSALSANFTSYASPITGTVAYLDPQLRDAPELAVPPNLKVTFSPTCSEPAIRLIDRVWTKLRG